MGRMGLVIRLIVLTACLGAFCRAGYIRSWFEGMDHVLNYCCPAVEIIEEPWYVCVCLCVCARACVCVCVCVIIIIIIINGLLEWQS